MPVTHQNSTINARRFAALLAGFDTGNTSEEEAISKARAMRRMALDVGLRIVDALELPDVKQAVDDQMQPKRNASAELEEATEYVAALQLELTERTREVRNLAELLQQEKEATKTAHRYTCVVPSSPALGVPSWGFEVGTSILGFTLLIAALVGGFSHEGSNGNGLGNSKGTYPAVVRKDGAVRAVPGGRPLHHRLRNGGSASRTR